MELWDGIEYADGGGEHPVAIGIVRIEEADIWIAGLAQTDVAAATRAFVRGE